jgi:hypothetical protein
MGEAPREERGFWLEMVRQGKGELPCHGLDHFGNACWLKREASAFKGVPLVV